METEMTQTEMTGTTTKTTPTADETGKGVHVVMKNKISGEIITACFKTRTHLAKALESENACWDVLYVFKGKKLPIKQKVSYNFN